MKIWSWVMAVLYMWKRRTTDRPGWDIEKKDDSPKRKFVPQLKLVRRWFSDKTTIGDLFIDGQWRMFILEDTVRDPNGSGNLDEEEKVYGETAIPYGTYEVLISF